MTLPPVALRCLASFSRVLLRCHCLPSLKFTVVRTCMVSMHHAMSLIVRNPQRSSAVPTCCAMFSFLLDEAGTFVLTLWFSRGSGRKANGFASGA